MQSHRSLIATSQFATAQAAGLAPLLQPHNTPPQMLVSSSADQGPELPDVTFRVRNYGFRKVWVGKTECPAFSTTAVTAPARSKQVMRCEKHPVIVTLRVGDAGIAGPGSLRVNSMKQAKGALWSHVVRNDAGSDVVKVWDALFGIPWFCIAGSLLVIALVVAVIAAIARR